MLDMLEAAITCPPSNSTLGKLSEAAERERAFEPRTDEQQGTRSLRTTHVADPQPVRVDETIAKTEDITILRRHGEVELRVHTAARRAGAAVEKNYFNIWSCY